MLSQPGDTGVIERSVPASLGRLFGRNSAPGVFGATAGLRSCSFELREAGSMQGETPQRHGNLKPKKRGRQQGGPRSGKKTPCVAFLVFLYIERDIEMESRAPRATP